MYSENITIKRLLLAFEVSKLYVKTGLSSQEISDLVGIPRATIKRYTNSIETKKDKYLKLLPELMTEEEINLFIRYIDKRHKINKRTCGWNSGELKKNLNDISVDVIKIKNLYKSIDQSISLGKKKEMEKMREAGKSYRDIAKYSGASLSHTYKSISDLEKMTDESNKENENIGRYI